MNEVKGKLEVDELTLLNAKVDAMTQRLERLNVNAVNSSAPPASCEVCGSIGHLLRIVKLGVLLPKTLATKPIMSIISTQN